MFQFLFTLLLTIESAVQKVLKIEKGDGYIQIAA